MSDHRQFYCDVDDSRWTTMQDCPGEVDPVTFDPYKSERDVIKFRCDEGPNKPELERRYVKCYNKDTIKNMYKNRATTPFLEPTTRGQFTDKALKKIAQKIGTSSGPATMFDLLNRTRNYSPQDEALLRYKLTPKPDSTVSPSEFMYAVMKGDIFKVKLYLRQRNSNPNIRDQNGNTPLIYASMDGNLDMAMLLAINGANINASNKNGMTPLMYASMNGNYNLVKFLKENGADPHEYSYTGQTAISVARTKKIKDYLEGKKTRTKSKSKPKTKKKTKSKSKSKTKTKKKTRSKSKPKPKTKKKTKSKSIRR